MPKMTLDSEPVIINDESSPLGIFLVKSGSKGDKLLFRYPYEIPKEAYKLSTQLKTQKTSDSTNPEQPSNSLGSINQEKKRNPYALKPEQDIHADTFEYNTNPSARSHQPLASTSKTSSGISPGDKSTNPFKFNAPDEFNKSAKKPIHIDANVDPAIMKVLNFPDELLANLFAVKSDLCGDKFELKINEVRFVGHPVLLSSKNNFQQAATSALNKESKKGNFTTPNKDREKDLVTFNVVFALRANASQEIVKCYYDCSKRIAIALHFEEQRVGYLTSETKIMTSHDDDIHDHDQDNEQIPYTSILERSGLAKILKKMYEDLSTFGALYLRINSWIEVSFCLPQKVHKLTLKYHEKIPCIDPSEIQRSLESLRPYHGILLLVDARDLFDTLPLDAAPALIRVIRVINPIKNLLEISADADISLTQVFHIVAQLVYWAKATIIYPFCENNVYMINPLSPLAIDSPLAKKFKKDFPGSDLLELMSEFSFGTSLSQLRNPLQDVEVQGQLVHKIIWLLRHRLLMQVHIYVYFMPNGGGSSIPYLTRKINSQMNLDSQDTSNESSSSVNYFASKERSATDPGLQVDKSLGSPYASGSRTTSPISFKKPNTSLGAQISSSYPQQHSFIASSFDSAGFETSFSSSYNKKYYGSASNLTTENKRQTLRGENITSSSGVTSNSNLDKSDSDEDVYSSQCAASNTFEESRLTLIADLGLTKSEIESLLAVPASNNLDDLRLFVRLCPFFNGNHHLEDIMYYANVRRSLLLALIDKFRDVLFTAQFEDKAVAHLCPYIQEK